MFVYRSGFIVSLFVFPIWLYSFFVEVSLASLLLPIKAIFRNFQFRLFWVMHWNWELEMFFCVYFPFERMRILLSKHCIVFKWDHICLWVLPAMGCFHVGCIFCSHMCAMAYNFQWNVLSYVNILFLPLFLLGSICIWGFHVSIHRFLRWLRNILLYFVFDKERSLVYDHLIISVN